MEKDKISENVEFEVLYADGTRRRVSEGILFGVDDEQITFHNGTNRGSVLFATAESALALIDHCGLTKLFSLYIRSDPEDTDTVRVINMLSSRPQKSTSAEDQALFRLGQMDMKENILEMLRTKEAPWGASRSALAEISDWVKSLEV